MLNTTLFASGTFHQGSECFNEGSRGRQCSVMALTAIMFDKRCIHVNKWNSEIINQILVQGDDMYLNCLRNRLIPDAESLSLKDIPTVLLWPCSSVQSYSNNWSAITDSIVKTNAALCEHGLPTVVGTTHENSPIVVKPIEACCVLMTNTMTNIESPIEATCKGSLMTNTHNISPVEANTFETSPIRVRDNYETSPIRVRDNYETSPIRVRNIELPDMVEAIEAQNKANENQYCFTEYGKEQQGLFRNEHEVEAPFFTLRSALVNTFTCNNYAIIILEGYMMALIHGVDSAFYLFDSHARDSAGMPDPSGTAVVMKLADISELEQYLFTLSDKLNAKCFEIVPVQVRPVNDQSNFSDKLYSDVSEFHNITTEDQGMTNKYVAFETKTNVSLSDVKREKKREKDRLYSHRKRLLETENEKQIRVEKAKLYKRNKISEETADQKQIRLEKAKQYFKAKISEETYSEKQIRVEKAKQYSKAKISEETYSEKEIRLEKLKQHSKAKISEETYSEKQIRLEKVKQCMKRKFTEETEIEKLNRLEYSKQYKKVKISEEADNEKQIRLEKANKKLSNQSENKMQERLKKNRLYKTQRATSTCIPPFNVRVLNQQEYLKEFDVVKNGPIHEQNWAKTNIEKFHKSVKFCTFKCTICHEAWPLKCKPRLPDNYMCSRCSRDKKSPKKISFENNMIPSPVPQQLQNLTQVEEMLIARALPIMRVYIKPGGQRGYSGHCINLPQNVKELATSLPRYPKDLSVVIVKVKGKDNTFKDVTVRRHKVHNALLWLINNNPHYAELQINVEALNSLPENGVPADLLTVETEDEVIPDDNIEPDSGPPTNHPDDDRVYNAATEMSSFLPVGEQQEQEIEAIRNQLSAQQPMNWPSVDDQPVNEYQTSFLATMAFPTLFPDGKGDPTNQALIRDVPLQERIKHLVKFAENIDGKWVYRFANHPRFSYWAFNMIQRKRILQQSGIFLKQNPGEAHLTIDELREMAESNSCAAFMSKVSRYVGNIAGTNAYWHKVKEDLKAIITNVGAPTFFFTFSSADMHWPELHDLFGENSGNLTAEQRRQNIINNPHIVDWFFSQRLESFVKHWLYDTLDATWHWFRYEYQGRGSIHCHGTAKLNNDPGLCQLTETALKGFLAQKYKDENDCPDTTELDQDIETGKKAADTACQYVDWLLSTVNPNPPDEDVWIRPPVHPCQRRYNDIQDFEKESDYCDLLNMVQRHTRCSTNYCLRKKGNESDLKCRFHFPFDHCPNTRIEFEEINSKSNDIKYRAKIITKRNDSRLNNNQQLQIQSWRANCDIQVVIDHYACVEYLTKYAAKGEPRSPLLKQAFNSIVKNVDNNSDPNRAIKKVVMKTLGERDYAAQETMHHLQSLKLHSSSFNVIPISLNGSRRVHNNPCAEESGTSCTNSSLLDVYANRQQYDSSLEIMNMNFLQFASKYKLVNHKLTRQPDNIIPRIFPTYSPNPKGTHFALYCKYQLLRYKPWQTTQNNVWGNQEQSDEILVNSWQEFLQTQYAQINVPDWFDKLQTVIQSQEEPEDEPVQPQDNTRDEWMILADLHTPFENPEQSLDSTHDWHEDIIHYTQQQIGEMPTWIITKKEQQSAIINEEYVVVDINSFSEMQRLAYYIVQSHFEDMSDEKDPLCMIIIGVAGTGKSYLINALRNLLRSKCVVSATTGKASYNIRGVTIHSLLKLPVGSRGQKDLTGESLCRLQQGLTGIEYIFIDEYSMLGQVTFGWIDKRCKQATGCHDKLLGGISLILIGDIGQLPPVADKPLYHAKPSNEIGEQGYQTYKMFDKVVKLTVNQRVQGESSEQAKFRELLLRLRKGKSTVEDWELLLTRQPANVENISEFDDAVRLYYTNEEVAHYNHEQLTKLQQPVAHIEARHSSARAKKISSDDMSGLEPIIFLAKGAKVMLTMNLWASVGLCNGATGTVIDFIYQIGQQPPNLPVAVIVQFDDYTGPSVSDTEPSCVPICPITISCQSESGFHERQQLPLRLAWALTIHKSQGLTLPKAWVNIGKSERTPGVSYVAISRVKTLSSLVIEPMTFERLTSMKSSATLQFRLEEEDRLDQAAKSTVTAFNIM